MEQLQQRRRRARVAVGLAGVLVGALLAAPPAQGADEVELLVNGGFEDGVAPWFANNGNSVDGGTLSLTEDALEGDHAVTITGRTSTGSGPMQDLSGKLTAGETYALTAHVRYDDPQSPATKQFFATMHYGGGSYTNLGTVTAERGEWSEISATFTIPAGQSVTTTRLFLETPWVPVADALAAPEVHLMDFSVDAVSLVGAAPPPAPEPPSTTIEVLGKVPGQHNPLISHKFGADAFGFVDDGRVYLYMTNDTQGYAPDPVTGISAQINYGDINQITVISSEDLVNWTDHGEIQVAGPNGVAPFTNNSWAPGLAKNVVDGEEKYFLYYANGGGSSNVITGESPVGPWTSERTTPLITASTPGTEGVAWPFDPAPFVDSDGTGYLYYGGGPAATTMPPEERFNNPKNLRGIELGEDMVSTVGSAVVVDAPVAFEAAHVFEREGLYYLSYSSHFGGNDFGGNQPRAEGYPGAGEIGYMISDDPMNWPKETYAGVLFPNQSVFFGAGTGGNNHQSVFEFHGTYYFTHHAPTLNKRITGDTTQGYRSPHIEAMEFNEDGTITQVVGTYEGVDQVQDLDPYRVIEAETIAWQQGLATKATDRPSAQFGEAAPNLVLHDVDDGDWTSLSSVDFGEANDVTLTASVLPLVEGATIEVRLDDLESDTVATLEVDGTVGEWGEASVELPGLGGVHDVYLVFAGPEGEDLVEVDTWEFTRGEPSGPVDPGPVDPGPVDPGPVDPGPVDPGPVDPGPVDPGPVDPGPVDPGPVDPGPPGPTFADVRPGQVFYDEIRWLADSGLSRGTVVGDQVFFYPSRGMSRQAMAAFMYRYSDHSDADWEPEAGTQTFSDVPPGHPFHTEIEWMAAQGLATGYEDGTYGASRRVSRQAMAAFLHRLAGEPVATSTTSFWDVTADSEFADAIAWLESVGIAEGYLDGSFGTTRRISRQAMAAFLHRFDEVISAG